MRAGPTRPIPGRRSRRRSPGSSGSIQAFLDFARPAEAVRRAVRPRRGPRADPRARLRPRATCKSVAIPTRARPDGPIVLEADAGQIRQVLLNLLLNALDATPEGGSITRPRATIRPTATPPGRSGRAGSRSEVVDSGHGLPPELGGRIFEPFVSTKETGLGLGLSICKRIVEAHGGRIHAADRARAAGPLFTVRLPVGGSDRRPPAADPLQWTDDRHTRWRLP